MQELLDVVNENDQIIGQIAGLDQKKRIAKSIFIELKIKNGKLASYRCKEAYKALENANLVGDGGRWLI